MPTNSNEASKASLKNLQEATANTSAGNYKKSLLEDFDPGISRKSSEKLRSVKSLPGVPSRPNSQLSKKSFGSKQSLDSSEKISGSKRSLASGSKENANELCVAAAGTPSTAVQASVLKQQESEIVMGSLPVALPGSRGYIDAMSSSEKLRHFQSPTTFDGDRPLAQLQSKEEDFKDVLRHTIREEDQLPALREHHLSESAIQEEMVEDTEIPFSSEDDIKLGASASTQWQDHSNPRELKKQIKRQRELKIDTPTAPKTQLPGPTRTALAEQIRARSQNSVTSRSLRQTPVNASELTRTHNDGSMAIKSQWQAQTSAKELPRANTGNLQQSLRSELAGGSYTGSNLSFTRQSQAVLSGRHRASSSASGYGVADSLVRSSSQVSIDPGKVGPDEIIERMKYGLNTKQRSQRSRGIRESQTSPRSPFAPKQSFFSDEEERDYERSKDSLGSGEELQVECLSRSSSGLFPLDRTWQFQGIFYDPSSRFRIC